MLAVNQEFSRCRTRGESEESIACRMIKHASKGSTMALKPRTDIQNRGISGPTKRTNVLQKLFLKISVDLSILSSAHLDVGTPQILFDNYVGSKEFKSADAPIDYPLFLIKNKGQ